MSSTTAAATATTTTYIHTKYIQSIKKKQQAYQLEKEEQLALYNIPNSTKAGKLKQKVRGIAHISSSRKYSAATTAHTALAALCLKRERREEVTILQQVSFKSLAKATVFK